MVVAVTCNSVLLLKSRFFLFEVCFGLVTVLGFGFVVYVISRSRLRLPTRDLVRRLLDYH